MTNSYLTEEDCTEYMNLPDSEPFDFTKEEVCNAANILDQYITWVGDKIDAKTVFNEATKELILGEIKKRRKHERI